MWFGLKSEIILLIFCTSSIHLVFRKFHFNLSICTYLMMLCYYRKTTIFIDLMKIYYILLSDFYVLDIFLLFLMYGYIYGGFNIWVLFDFNSKLWREDSDKLHYVWRNNILTWFSKKNYLFFPFLAYFGLKR